MNILHMQIIYYRKNQLESRPQISMEVSKELNNLK